MAWVGRPIGSVQDQNIVFDAWPGLRKMHELALAYPSDVAFSPRGDVLLSADLLAATSLPQKSGRLSGG
jgi:hypothetical protein